MLDQKGNVDFGSPYFSQRVMREVMSSDHYADHVETIRGTYRQKRDAMLAAADDHFSSITGVRWHRPSGGLYVWLELPGDVDTGPAGNLLTAAIGEGMLYVPGQYCFPSEGQGVRYNYIRLSYGVQSPKRIDQGIAALARAIRQTPG